MENKTPANTKRTFFVRLLGFTGAHPLLSLSIILGGLGIGLLIGLAVASGVGYLVYDYTQHNPKFCITCHDVMIESYTTWEKSEHADVNCHTCHHLTPEVLRSHTVALLTGMPEKIPPRPEGKVLVASHICMECHWEKEKELEWWQKWMQKQVIQSSNVASSEFHATHFFTAQTECFTCHGAQQLHVFTAQPEDCLDCHENYQPQIHTAKNVELACLNCHTDQTAELLPNREKCLACHSEDDTFRQKLVDSASLDVKYAQLSEEMVAQASKISLPDRAPMEQLNCAECHRSHSQETISPRETCLSCHANKIENTEHASHLPYFQSDCLTCHQPHSWSITEEWAQQECAKCHEYRAPFTFTQTKKE